MRLVGIVAMAVVALGLGTAGGWLAAHRAFDPKHEHFAPNNAERPRESLGRTASVESSKPQPRVLVRPGERYDFGKMPRGTTGRHVFYIANVGNAPLTIKKGQTTCKCTLSTLEDGVVEPGETVAVTLEWTVKSDENYFSQMAELITNDPERGVVQLRIEGYVEDLVRLTPDEIVFMNVAGNQSQTRPLYVYAARKEDNIRVEEVGFVDASTANYFEAEVRDLTDEELAEQPMAKAGQVVLVTLKPGLPTGEIHQNLRVKLNVPDMPEQIIPIRGMIQSDVSVVGRLAMFDPRTNLLNLGGVLQDQGARAELLVLLKGDQRDQIEVTVAEVDPPEALRVTLGERKVSDRLITIPLTVEVPVGAPRVTRLGSEQGKLGTIRLEASNSLTKEVHIKVRFAVN
ncbi:MAG: hypothetical protein KatS3mg109_0309 [Pirellulaceae bacterium]|nr:MAG: hypothetical protein KatS3mg109_0309 [Pirellulaceae bacterium]GIW96519.1 MAG: hypothetical protein KatS3mg110_4560 [Pirellulaceae bacterium]